MTSILPDPAAGAALSKLDKNTARHQRRNFRFGLSAKLLGLTIAFVMFAEILIFVPSVANFRKNWLMERLSAAQIAALATQASANNTVPDRLRTQLLKKAMVHSVAIHRGGARMLVLQSEVPGMVDAHFDLEHASWVELIGDALYSFIAPPKRLIRVMGRPDLGDETLEIVITETPLKAAIYQFAFNILILSILISLFTATLVYISLSIIFVRPISGLTWNIVRFRENPEDGDRIIKPSGRADEIGMAQEELSAMQNELATMLRQKSRLAALGLAVSKISHDLRNMLSNAQLISDRLGSAADPTVQKFAPKLIASLDRAISFCNETLRYGRAEEARPERHPFLLKPLLDEVGESLSLLGQKRIRWIIEADETLEIDADRSQLYRILTNLARNSIQALEAPPEQLRPEIAMSARRETNAIMITIQDNGPGVPARAKANLFQAFHGSARAGGTGLGLAISAELVRAHGGEIWLDDTAPGAIFHIRLPHSQANDEISGGEGRNLASGILAFGRAKH